MTEDFRIEKDSMGEVSVPVDAYYGASTQRAVDNFPISGQGVGRRLIWAFGLLKGSAATVAAGRKEIPEDVAAGVLMGNAGGTWVTTRCGITDPGALLSTFDEPRGQGIKLVIGLVILAAVLAYSIRRVRRRDAAAPARDGG